jgi:NDP-sugar pyrophosphorylase family protein
VIDVDLAQVVARHVRTGAAATMVLRETADAARWGAIEVGADGRVTRILDQGAAGAHLCMFTGVQVLTPRLIERLPPEGASDSIRQAYLPALAAGEHIEGYLLDGYFHEHSTPERYLEGNWNLLDGRARLAHAPGPLDGVAPAARVHASATLRPPYRISDGAEVAAGAEVGPHAVVGRDARIGARARLERVVVWPQAALDEPLRDGIVTPRGIYRRGAPHGR